MRLVDSCGGMRLHGNSRYFLFCMLGFRLGGSLALPWIALPWIALPWIGFLFLWIAFLFLCLYVGGESPYFYDSGVGVDGLAVFSCEDLEGLEGGGGFI